MPSCDGVPAPMQIIGIHGAPRSGSSWLGQIFNSSPAVAYRFQPLFSYAFRGRFDEAASPEEVHRFFEDLASTEDDFVLQRGAARVPREEWSFAKREPTHLVYKEVRFHNLVHRLMSAEPRMRLVGIIRDPVDTLTSWANAPREFNSEWLIEDEWRFAPTKNNGKPEEFNGYEGWKRTATLLLELSSLYEDRVHIVSYEELVRDPEGGAARIFRFCDLEVTPQVRDFVRLSTTTQDDDPYGVRRSRRPGRSGRHLSPDVVAWIRADVEAAGLERFLRLADRSSAGRAQG